MKHPEYELNMILHQLHNEHRGIEAPSNLEDLLVQRSRLNAGSAASQRWSRAWGLGFALVVIAAAVVWWASIHAPSSHPPQQIVMLPAPAIQTPPIQQAPTAPQTVAQGQANSRHITQRGQRHAGYSTQVEGSVVFATSFLPLPASEALPEPAQQSIVRARILTSSLAQYGLEVPASIAPQLVSAEFLVGEDGLPRAIRFVR